MSLQYIKSKQISHVLPVCIFVTPFTNNFNIDVNFSTGNRSISSVPEDGLASMLMIYDTISDQVSKHGDAISDSTAL